MKIIKDGKLPERKPKATEVIYRHTCYKCGCQFECYEDETSTETKTYTEMSLFAFGAGRDIVTKTYVKVNCPFCDESNRLKTIDESRTWKPWDR